MARLGLDRGMALVLAAMAPGAAGASAPQPAGGPATWTMVVRHLDTHPHTPHAARVSLDRLDDAALEVCGASSFSLREVKAGVRASRCWRDSMADALARIDDPVLAAAYRREQSRHR